MFEENFEYFPTLKEIRDGLIKGQIHMLETQKNNWNDESKFAAMKIGYVT